MRKVAYLYCFVLGVTIISTVSSVVSQTGDFKNKEQKVDYKVLPTMDLNAGISDVLYDNPALQSLDLSASKDKVNYELTGASIETEEIIEVDEDDIIEYNTTELDEQSNIDSDTTEHTEQTENIIQDNAEDNTQDNAEVDIEETIDTEW